jgi:hypothetical protein
MKGRRSGSVLGAVFLGCGSAGSPNAATTVGQQCAEVLGAFCVRAYDQCGAVADDGGADGGANADGAVEAGEAGVSDGGASTIAACVGAGVALCCQQSNDCSAGAITPEGDIQACVNDMKAQACGSLLADPPELPQTCQQVIRRPQ